MPTKKMDEKEDKKISNNRVSFEFLKVWTLLYLAKMSTSSFSLVLKLHLKLECLHEIETLSTQGDFQVNTLIIDCFNMCYLL